jgi:hypothetical protein
MMGPLFALFRAPCLNSRLPLPRPLGLSASRSSDFGRQKNFLFFLYLKIPRFLGVAQVIFRFKTRQRAKSNTYRLPQISDYHVKRAIPGNRSPSCTVNH